MARLTIAFLVVAGIVLRVAIQNSSLGTLNSDEAVFGLMVRSMQQGSFPVFLWGQAYGGSGEGLVAAPLFALFGASALTLKLSTMIISAVCCILVWRVATYVMSPPAAMIAGALFWAFPGPFVWWSTKPTGFYWTLLFCGLAALWIVLWLDEHRPHGWRAGGLYALLGFLIGVGWWSNPQIMFFAIPAGAFLLVRNGKAIRWAPLVALGGAIGAIPWLYVNVRNGFPSLEAPAAKADYFERLWVVTTRGIPSLMSTKALFAETWVGGWVGFVAFVALIALTVIGCVLLCRSPAGILMTAILALYPFFAAVSTVSDYVGEGRYMLFAAPFVVIALARLLDVTKWAHALPVGAVALSAGLLVASVGYTDIAVPRSTGAVRAAMQDRGITNAYAGYWTSYRIVFESGEKLIVTSTEQDRNPAYTATVRADPRAGRIFVLNDADDQRYQSLLGGSPEVERIPAGGYVLYITNGENWDAFDDRLRRTP